MVVCWALFAARFSTCLLADSPLSRVEPVARVRLLGALILLSLGGIALVVLCWLALRAGRRTLRREDRILKKFSLPAKSDDWAATPLVKPDKIHSDDPLG